MGLVLPVLLLCLVLPDSQAFKPFNFGKSITHRRITETAILQKTAEVCRAVATAEGRDFILSNSLSATSVQQACSPSDAGLLTAAKFKASIVAIYISNAVVDGAYALSDRHHFDGESFTDGRKLITEGMASIKANIQQENFIPARLTLGKICHTLQDFYSHSNWIELGSKRPNTNLIRPDPTLPIGNLAGKCSHGGSLDKTSRTDPVGGINKDDFEADHGHLHREAANVAINATMELLEDIRGAAGENDFLRLMGITRSSVLCFVIDTTGSMSDDIAEAKRVAFSIIDSKKGTLEEPSVYILVPFNDPEFGPLTRTTDSNIFKQQINVLTAEGGGDPPEMSLSGLQVTFLLTNALSARRRRDSNGGQDQRQRFSSRLSPAGNDLYQELAEISGGQAIVVTKATLPQVTDIIVDSSTPALVNILQAVRNPGRPDNFTFTVDPSVRNLTVYLTGSPLTFSLHSPTGHSDTDFIYNIVEMSQGSGTGFTVKDGRPQTGRNITLLLSVVGGDSPNVMEVALVEVSGSGVENGTIEALGDGDYLVFMERVPDDEFVVLALANSTMEPGIPFSLPFSVTTNGTAGNYTVRARDDRGFITSFTTSLVLSSGGTAQGSVELQAPDSTPSGTDVTLTIEAEAPGAADSNYAVLRLSVIAKVTDFSQPVCQVVTVHANCSKDCSQSEWEISANLTDGNGTGIQSVTARRGNGTLNTTTTVGEEGNNMTTATYSASCCSPEVELVAVDAVGNVGTCFHSLRLAPNLATSILPPSSSPSPAASDTTTNLQTTPSGATALLLPPLLIPLALLTAQWA
ncbi:hypothetical protein JZ751_015445 [Albula glossodonta]|uniref:von Willebrand factor A domain-containing protein 7-like n=1 Tax=Albula glossodonta TaxID=121402 RepID=A0A8T2MWE2_9TELE|nr:hypothetical protein JZ751_015445 [Albula glossodonta]